MFLVCRGEEGGGRGVRVGPDSWAPAGGRGTLFSSSVTLSLSQYSVFELSEIFRQLEQRGKLQRLIASEVSPVPASCFCNRGNVRYYDEERKTNRNDE